MQKTLELTNDVAQVPMLAEWIDALCEELSLPPQTPFQLNLALEEAVVNVMKYAYPGQEGMPVKLSVSTDGNDLCFVLSDNGIPFDPTQAEDPDITLSAVERQIGGLGIFLVQQLMKTVSYKRENEQNILTMVYSVPQE